MRTGEKGLALIKSFEGLRLKAYPDPATGGEPITIGYGHTGKIPLGLTITQEQADRFLRDDLARFETFVSTTTPKATQHQFDALVSLAFNIGTANLKSSTLLKMHKAGDHEGARKQFLRWNRGAGRVMPGLTRRREAEAKLYGEA